MVLLLLPIIFGCVLPNMLSVFNGTEASGGAG